MSTPLPKPGFTLIEILVALVVGGFLFSSGLAAYRGFGERQEVRQAGSVFQTNLRSFQRKASSGEKASDCIGNLDGYRVVYLDSSSYAMQADCSINSPDSQSIDLEDGVNFTSDWGEIFFPVLRAPVSGSSEVEISNDSYSYVVTIEPSGLIVGEFQQ